MMSHSTNKIQLAGGDISYMEGGSGSPLVFLHHSIGSHGWLPLYDRLAERHRVIVPDVPGFGESERLDWARDVRDITAHLLAGLEVMGLERVTLVGCGLGGWIAAEMAVMNQGRVEKLVLVGAAGIQPRTGEIIDQLVIDYVDYVQLGFNDSAAFEQHFTEDPPVPTRMTLYASREMTMRIVWKPWMFSRQLPHLLRNVRTPAVVIWGSNDRVIPLDAGRQFAESLPNSRLIVVEGGGHNLDFERPDEVARAILHVDIAAVTAR